MTRKSCGALALVTIALTALASLSTARAQTVSRLDITDHGIYVKDKCTPERDAPGTLSKDACDSVRLVETTTSVPARHGVIFGFGYRVIGTPEGQNVTIKTVVIYPAGGVKSPGSATPLQTTELTFTNAIGSNRVSWYSFDEPWELVPGTWTLQAWVGDRKLAEKSFTIVAQ